MALATVAPIIATVLPAPVVPKKILCCTDRFVACQTCRPVNRSRPR